MYLCSNKAEYLNGRYFSVNWDVDDAEMKKADILKRDLLKFTLAGEFGAENFVKN